MAHRMMRLLAAIVAMAAALFIAAAAFADHHRAEPQRPGQVNILLVTVDDMNWNSVGAFGNPIADITPHIDQLAREGRRFERAYVAASNCSPSRVAIQTGLYPQQTGATGFFYVDDRAAPSIATELRSNGYFTAVINKIADTNPSPEASRYWDVRDNFDGAQKYSARAYGERSAAVIDQAKKRGQPFYLVVNIADPHKPNFNDPQATSAGADAYAPSRIITEAEVTIPGFLPELPRIRRDVRNYYNSVRRADDALGQIMQSLRASGMEDSTLVIFLSDHGMPFPFAKSSVYDNGLRTPLIMRWPGRIQPGGVEPGIASAIDLMPTILDAAGARMPSARPYFGRALLRPGQPEQTPYAFGSFDENAKGYPVPMRGVISRDWGYTFNAWSDGEHAIKNDDMNHASFREMERRAGEFPAVKARLDYYLTRPTEELCHLAVDPDCLVNLAQDPAHAGVLAEMRAALRAQMARTGDYLLEAFDARADRARLRAFMRRQHQAAKDRAAKLQWKRETNIEGRTRSHGDVFRKEGM